MADDAEIGVTHVIRGEDHVTNTGVQIEIFEALGAAPPQFAHHPLLVGADGAALSKRLGSLSISELKREGYEPLAITSHLARLGTSDPLEVGRQPRRPEGRLRLRQVRPRAGALRPGRPEAAQRPDPARPAVRRGAGAS